MLEIYSLTTITLTFAVAFLVTFTTVPVIARIMRRYGIIGFDVHKQSKTAIPEMCGLAILIGLVMATLVHVILAPSAVRDAVTFIGVVLIAGAIGFIDDLRALGPRIKPLLTALACLPIFLMRTYDPLPTIPFLGPVRLTVVYPILIPVAIAVTSNAVNMMDVMNGSMAGTVSIICIAITGVLLAAGNLTVATLSSGLLAALLAFYYFNRFPAKVFGGDTASLAVGAALGVLSILGRIETIMIVALIPHIMNAFYGLASVGRLYERREIHQRPIEVLGNGLLDASDEKDAPVTLARLILATGPLSEKEVVRGMMLLTLVSSALSILTYWVGTVGKI